MPREKKTFVTTDDTNKTYEYPRQWHEDNVQVWEVEVSMNALDDNSGHTSGLDTIKSFFVERSTIEKLMLRPIAKKDAAPEEVKFEPAYGLR
jgi:hypothetical protein